MTPRPPSATLLPLETLLIGAWLAVVVALPVVLVLFNRELPAHDAARIGHLLRHRAGVAEGLLGFFVVLLHLRRRARGIPLVLPFAAFALSVVWALFAAPLAAEVAPLATPPWLPRADATRSLLEALLLFAAFFTGSRA